MQPAGFLRRFFAVFVDYIIINFWLFCILLVCGLYLDQTRVDIISFVCTVICFFLYTPFFESSSHQATPGERVVKIKVCSIAHERLTFGQAFLRVVAGIFSVVALVSIWLLWVLMVRIMQSKLIALLAIPGIVLSILWILGTYYLRFFSKRTQTFCDYASNSLMLVPTKIPLCQEAHVNSCLPLDDMKHE